MMVENTVDTYAPFTPTYTTNTTSVERLVTTNARVRGSRISSRGRASADSPATTGSTPIPIASAPRAQDACSGMRSRKKPVVSRQLCERWPRKAENVTAMPTARTAAPAQSQVDHVERHRRACPDCQTYQSPPSAKTANRIESCVRVNIAAAQTTSAVATRIQLGEANARAMSQRDSVETGYASGSSTRNGEYESAGTVTAPAAAASAYHGRTTIRASAYAGKIVAVIARTSRT